MRTLSSSKGTGGTVKTEPEDFIVKEINSKGHVLNPDERYTPEQLEEPENKEGKFTTFILQKRDWETVNALIRIAKATGHGKKSIGYAGSKDRKAITVQLASIFGVEPQQMLSIRIKDMSINGAWKSDGIELGSNVGNAFTARIRDCTNPGRINDIVSELNGAAPNYFDRQRFGLRMNNFAVGMRMLKLDFEGAVAEFLTNPNGETNEDSVAARKALAEDMDFNKALQYFPGYLKGERSVIEYMTRYDNPANALRKLPRGVLLMFVHAVQSAVFNASLEQRLKDNNMESEARCGTNFYGFPEPEKPSREGSFALGNIIGYETKSEQMDVTEKDILGRLELNLEDFKIKSMPELSVRGSLRTLLMPLKDLSYTEEENGIAVSFSIPSGSYATIVLNEITKADSLSIGDITRPYSIV